MNTNLKSIARKAVAGLGLVVALTGCDMKAQTDQNNLEVARNVYKTGHPKVLEITLVDDEYVHYGPQRRFIDIDGDGKTVEQYVECFGTVVGSAFPIGVKVNLIRSGYEKKAQFDPNHVRTMTPQEAKKIDAEYQALLRNQKL